MAAKKKLDGRTKEGRAAKARALARAAKKGTKKKRAPLAKAKKATKKNGKAKAVKMGGYTFQQRGRVPAAGSVVVTDDGHIGVLDSVVGKLANVVTFDHPESGFRVISIVPAKELWRATKGEKAVLAFVQRELLRARTESRFQPVVSLTSAESPAETVEAVHEDTTEAERMAVVADVLKGSFPSETTTDGVSF
jgi:hypothetical protein